MYRPKEMEVTGSWKELFDGELHNMYFAKHYWGGLFLISNFFRVLNAVCFWVIPRHLNYPEESIHYWGE